MDSINLFTTPLNINNTNVSRLSQQKKEIDQGIRSIFNTIQTQLTVLKPLIKNETVAISLQQGMNRIRTMLYPPLINYMAPAIFQNSYLPLCHMKDAISMARTCRAYYSMVQQPQFWANKIRREIPYPVFPIPINAQLPMTVGRFHLHKQAFSNLPEITQSAPRFRFDDVTFHTKNAAGEIVILSTKREKYLGPKKVMHLLRNNNRYQLPDFPKLTSKQLTEDYISLKNTNTIVHVGMRKEGRVKHGKGSMLFTVTQYNYMSAKIVKAFESVITNTPQCLIDKHMYMRCQQGGPSTIICKLVRESTGREIIIDLNLKTTKMEPQKLFLRTYLKNSNAYIEYNHIEKRYTLHRENATPLSLNLEDTDLQAVVHTALSPDETHFAVLRLQREQLNLILWDLTYGTQRSFPDISPPKMRGYPDGSFRFDNIDCFNFLSQHVVAIDSPRSWTIIRLGPPLERSSLSVETRYRHSVIGVDTDPYGLLISSEGYYRDYYSLIPNKIRE